MKNTSHSYQAIAKYLSQYGEIEANTIDQCLPQTLYQRCIVMPLYNETQDCIERIRHSPLTQQNLLLILVINQPDNTHDTTNNQQLWNTLCDQYTTLHHYQHDNYTGQWLHSQSPNKHSFDVLLINRFDHKIPQQQGVGLARKIGGDIACKLLINGRLNTHWVHHSDADTHLPHDYFSALDNALEQEGNNRHTRYSAAVYDYQHQTHQDSALATATAYYQQALHYYVAGLHYAESPYAYHTLGSCIATHALHYCQARGFPKKAGGEDFYLLNKMAKLGNILAINNTHLTIEARHSDRVPFGTGPAVEKIIAMANPHTDYLYYHPNCFVELKTLLSQFKCLYAHHKKTKTQAHNLDHYHAWLSTLSQPLQQALNQLKFNVLLQHIDQHITNPQQCLSHCHQWLDGFKTLKLIHLLEAHYPKQALSKSLKTAVFLDNT